MDVVSIIVPLLETGTLSVPGHGSEVHANPNFRIFASRRYLAGQLQFVCILDMVENISHDINCSACNR